VAPNRSFDMKRLNQSKNYVQLIWGSALAVVGAAVFFRIPQVMPQLAQMGLSGTTLWAVRISFYLMGFLLIGGGVRKIIQYFRPDSTTRPQDPSDGLENKSDR
jgi:steroid 5-alpha reductase family enzyme